MKEIGEALKEARESIGITIEEAANDLKLKPSQIENIEAGNKDAFQDVFYLKYFIRDYSKYLGLDYEDMIDEFNEFLFDYTSKISLDDIKKAKKQVLNNEKKEERKVVSPYTYEKQNKLKISPIIIYILIVLILVVGCCFVIKGLDNNSPKENTTENIIK
ncbi:MAG: helix-turn-helix domain-containing protein [Bacilli bacterium]|nr:helix-turn-helix domain-containing protein [Bacilli bacterium]